MIKNHESKEKTEESKDSVEVTQKEEERPKSPTPPPARKSPEPSCAICLEHLTNKSFTDSCFHMFCFTCLVEWSKVKPECPLCKKSFSSIVHNVRSFKDYDQYYVNKSIVSEDSLRIRRFQYRTTLTPERVRDNSRVELESYLSHRMRFAPHSVHSFRISYASSTALTSARRIPNSFRQRVYDENLWVFPQNSNRVRCISPQFYGQNVACTHRLLPFLNRELLVVMPNNESQISFVIELIMALITKYDIRSQEFQTLIEPYTASHTAHFIHEFYNFAISPYETLDSYDQHAQYNIEPVQSYETVSSPDSDVIPLPPIGYSHAQSTSSESSRRKKQSHPKKKHSKGCKKLKKIILKRNSEKDVWESSLEPSVSFGNSNYVPNPMSSIEFAVPSTSRGIQFLPESPGNRSSSDIDVVNVEESLETRNDVEDDDDEIQVVDVLKPRGERTPEIVNLSSDDELSNITGEVSADDKIDSTFISVDETDHLSDVTLILSDDECEILCVKEAPPIEINTSTSTTDEIVLDKPIDYSLKTIEKKFDIETSAPDVEACSSSNNINLIEQNVSELHKLVGDSKTKLEQVIKPERSSVITDTKAKLEKVIKPERGSVIQSVVRTVSNEDTASSSFSPLLKPKRRKTVILDDVSTESCSDGAQVSESDSTRKKKLKLKSVVAHYSYENSDEHESTHHSSRHKRHRDRDRRKKKKKHKHRRPTFSSDTD